MCVIIYVMLIFQEGKSTVLPKGITPKIRDFRTFLEIYSFALACKQTDANFGNYNVFVKIYIQAKLFKFDTVRGYYAI